MSCRGSFDLLRQVPKVNHILDPGRRFWTEVKYQRRIYMGKNLVFIEDTNLRYRHTSEVISLILCRFSSALWQLYGSESTIWSAQISIAQRRA